MELRKEAIVLRRKGKTYTEIQEVLRVKIPKSTLSYWCKNCSFSSTELKRIQTRIQRGGERGRSAALAAKRTRRNLHLEALQKENGYLPEVLFRDISIAKAGLTILYLAEGAKHRKGSLMFGNSDPHIITLFLKLLNFVYKIDKSRFRCTVQCRADQDVKALELYWSHLTEIPLSQFYKARVDARTIGKVSRKKDYKGVCRIDYFSAEIYNDLLIAGKIISGNM